MTPSLHVRKKNVTGEDKRREREEEGEKKFHGGEKKTPSLVEL